MERRRLRSNLNEIHKIVRGMDNVNAHGMFLRVKDSKTGDHRFMVKEESFKRDLEQHFPRG